jgi:hypothetical protein
MTLEQDSMISGVLLIVFFMGVSLGAIISMIHCSEKYLIETNKKQKTTIDKQEQTVAENFNTVEK